MRDLIVAVIVFGALPTVFMRPYIGVYVWSWIGYMNPHRLGWGFAYNFPFAMIAGVATIAGLLFYRGRKPLPWNSVTVTWAAFLIWISITALFAIYPDPAFEQWSKVIKIQVMVLITMLLIRDRKRIEGLIWVIVLSLGFYGVKGGLFAIRTGGSYIVWGPAGTFIGGNNELAFALVMVIPLMWFLFQMGSNKWLRYGLAGMMALSALSVFASYSRGAFIAVFATAGYLWMKSRSKLPLILIGILLIPTGFLFMPEEWAQRIFGISDYQGSDSAMGRIYAWILATKVALGSPIVGAGFGAFSGRGLHELYAESITGSADSLEGGGVYIATDPHSIYFLVLGEHGFVGLFLFLLLLYGSFRMAGRIKRLTQDHEDLHWARILGPALQASIVAYAVGGAFLGQSYFDLYYHLIALSVVTRQYVLDVVSGSDNASDKVLWRSAARPGLPGSSGR